MVQSFSSIFTQSEYNDKANIFALSEFIILWADLYIHVPTLNEIFQNECILGHTDTYLNKYSICYSIFNLIKVVLREKVINENNLRNVKVLECNIIINWLK